MKTGSLRSVWLHELRWPEIKAYLETSDVALVPIGATEQHGFHLPLSVDTGWAIAASVLAATKANVLVAPPLPYGWSPHHMGYPGTVTLAAETLRLVAIDIATSLIHHGFKRIIFVNGNRIANLPPLEIAAVQIKHLTGAYVGIADAGLIAKTEVAAMCSASDGGLEHAGEAETAFALHWAGADVDMSAIPSVGAQHDAPQHNEVRSSFDYTIELDPMKHGNSVSYAVSPLEHYQATAPTGSKADARPATPELGRRMVEAIATNLAAFIDEVRRQPLGPVKAGVPV